MIYMLEIFAIFLKKIKKRRIRGGCDTVASSEMNSGPLFNQIDQMDPYNGGLVQ